ncbi:MAG: hypothetical protein M1268_03310 [Patescibacteria group bacterium]|nr:hypothetical protein [Patescibacteria group bacterium]
MDPKNPSQLDPKLKEAYDRVMGTNISPSSPASQPSMSTPQSPISEPAAPQVFTPTTSPRPQTVSASSQPQTTMVNSPSSSFVAKPGKAKSGGFSPVLIIFGLLVFFAVYALFWVKFFGISIPFLPL